MVVTFITKPLVMLSAAKHLLSEVGKTHSEWNVPRAYVYLMTNRSRTLYVGVTNNLMRRVVEHKTATGKTFTARYKIDRLVWF